ncbi:MAG: hypothetical protein WCS90_03080 [Bacilli bacterium]
MIVTEEASKSSLFLARGNPFSWKKFLFKGGLIAFVILLVEIFLCNFKAYQNQGSSFSYAMSDCATTSLRADANKADDYTVTSREPTITVSGLSVSVKTLYIDAAYDDDGHYELDGTVSYLDGGRDSYYSVASFSIVTTYEKSRYVQLDLPEGTTSLQVKITNAQPGDLITLKGFKINAKIPFDFSWVRIAVMAIPAYLIFFFLEMRRYKDFLSLHSVIAPILRGMSLALSFGIIIFVMERGGWLANAFFQTSGSQVSQELVDAFLAGKVSLLTEPSSALIALTNPYNPASRYGISVLWDHVYFNGHYYSYYGVTPVFLFYLPMHLMSGKYVFDAYGILIFSLIGTAALAFAYKRLLKAFFSDQKIPLFLELAVYWILFFASGVLTNLTRPYFYEDATSSAFMCMSLALLNLAYAGFFDAGKSKLRWWLLGFSGFWIALAVLSRATMALYAVAFVVMLIVYHLRHKTELDKKSAILLYVVAFVPMLPFAIFQCWYNKARFGSITDFGIEYSLTIADFKHMSFKPVNVIASLWNFLFSFPQVNWENNHFFLDYAPTKFGSDFYFIEAGAAYGLFARVPILFVLPVLPFLKEGRDGKTRLLDGFGYGVPCVLIPLVIVALTWQSGYAPRYYSDFSVPLLLLALLWFIHRYLAIEKTSDKERLLSGIVIASCLYAIATSSAMLLFWVPNLYYHDYGLQIWSYTADYYKAYRQLTFWE